MSSMIGMRTGAARLEDPRHPGDDKAAEALFERVVARIVATHDFAPNLARQALDQALIFLVVAAQDTSRALSPSPTVDAAWDTFILYTAEYNHHCRRHGAFVHHTPSDNPEVLRSARNVYTVGETADLLREQGFYVLDGLWPRDAAATSKANCTSCYSGDHVGDGGGG
ncbi:glycine-rich domain-containing protein [Nonomuraea typhae]|uniref:glycine-rich domain-containing protein n=1 Tax=Nonomuraea typhae TaxID=2603600 RepID=UPI0012FA160C|nr:hypothetical protein [Nonomuraea typhae]